MREGGGGRERAEGVGRESTGDVVAILGSEFTFQGSRLTVQGVVRRVQGCRVQGVGVQGVGCRV